MVMRRSDVNSWVQTYGGAQLRTFNKTVGFYINAYVRATSGNSSYTRGQWHYVNWNIANYSNSVYNNYVDGGINAGNIIYPIDIIDTLEDLTRRTVDLIEPALGTKFINAYYCHASCHSSCHSSRGRR